VGGLLEQGEEGQEEVELGEVVDLEMRVEVVGGEGVVADADAGIEDELVVGLLVGGGG
jgi:hypothetical protein